VLSIVPHFLAKSSLTGTPAPKIFWSSSFKTGVLGGVFGLLPLILLLIASNNLSSSSSLIKKACQAVKSF